MANSVETYGGKHERLIASARALLHEQGVQRTTLAEVAERAQVPPGNVYYYFKTKDELVAARLYVTFRTPSIPAAACSGIVHV